MAIDGMASFAKFVIVWFRDRRRFPFEQSDRAVMSFPRPNAADVLMSGWGV